MEDTIYVEGEWKMKQLGSTGVSQQRWVPNATGLKNSSERRNQHRMLSERGRRRERQRVCKLIRSQWGWEEACKDKWKITVDRANDQCCRLHFCTVGLTWSPSFFLLSHPISLHFPFIPLFFFLIKAQDPKSCLKWAWLWDQREESFSSFPTQQVWKYYFMIF